MLTVNKLMPQGRGLAAALRKRATTVELDWDVRQKSRFDATDSAGRSLGVFLPRGTQLRGGDVLVAADGSLIVARAAPQPVLVVRHCPDHGAPSDLARAAYHLGNRHVAVEVKPDHLKLEPDHVLAGMLRRMHLLVSHDQAPFEPEGGAYQGGHAVDHGHGNDQGLAHAPLLPPGGARAHPASADEPAPGAHHDHHPDPADRHVGHAHDHQHAGHDHAHGASHGAHEHPQAGPQNHTDPTRTAAAD